MNDSFKETLLHAIESKPVPSFSLSSVVNRAPGTSYKASARRRFPGWLLLCVAVPAIAVAAALRFVPFDVTHKYGMWQVNPPVRASREYHYPSQATLAKVAQSAPYHITWPAGVPKSSVLEYLDSEASQMFLLFYPCPGKLSDYSAIIVIPKSYSAINPSLGKWFESQIIPRGRTLKWVVGDERMLIESTCLSWAQMEHVRSATLTTDTASERSQLRTAGRPR